MAAKLLRAVAKCWLTADYKTVVGDGDPLANTLLARKGEVIRPEKVEGRYAGYEGFFEEVNPAGQTTFAARNRALPAPPPKPEVPRRGPAPKRDKKGAGEAE
jgi:hypothetical protein